MKCRDCKYWIEAKGYERQDDVGGCTFTLDEPRFYPMFLDEECNLKEPFKSQVERENRKGGFSL